MEVVGGEVVPPPSTSKRSSSSSIMLSCWTTGNFSQNSEMEKLDELLLERRVFSEILGWQGGEKLSGAENNEFWQKKNN